MRSTRLLVCRVGDALTTSTAFEVAKRRAPVDAPTTFRDDMHAGLVELVARSSSLRFPSPLYQQDPVRYCREVLGFEPWSKQIEILETVRDCMRVAVSSGHKIGKSTTIAALALWFYCSFKDARVIMSSTTSRQVDQILWRELRMLRARSGRCVSCKRADPEGFRIPRPCPHSALIEGEQGELARTGLKSPDFREIVGFTAREAEAVAGISGQNLLYLLDEASGIPDNIYQAIEGNRAGGARIVLMGNPTKNEGEFFEAFFAKAHLYKTIRISSETTPNVISGQMLIPGLATREWIDEKKIEWGENGPLYRVRVKGEHAISEEGKIFSIHAIAEAELRWRETPESGRLFVGVDPAGETGSGDETAFAARRGNKHILLQTYTGLNADQHLAYLVQILTALRKPLEIPVVVLDAEGTIGRKLASRLRSYLDEDAHKDAFELITVRASEFAGPSRPTWDRIRDVLVANLEMWIRGGGAILEDVKLSRELHVFEWRRRADNRHKATPKDTIRKLLGRSPDRFDALALSVWEPTRVRDEQGKEMPPSVQRIAAASAENEGVYTPVPLHDPYAGAELWQKS